MPTHDVLGSVSIETPDLIVVPVVVSVPATAVQPHSLAAISHSSSSASVDARTETTAEAAVRPSSDAHSNHGCASGASGIVFEARTLGAPTAATASPSSSVCSYICTTLPVPGKFHPQRALQLGVPKGPLFGRLSKNETVVLDNGVTVSPEQVKDPDCPGAPFAIVSCPTLACLAPVVTALSWQPYYHTDCSSTSAAAAATASTAAADTPSRLQPFRCMVHLGPRNVVLHPDYQAWLQRFGDTTEHIFVRSASFTVSFVCPCPALPLPNMPCPAHPFSSPALCPSPLSVQANSAQEWAWLHWPEVSMFAPRIPLRAGVHLSSRLHGIHGGMFCWPASLACLPASGTRPVSDARSTGDVAAAKGPRITLAVRFGICPSLAVLLLPLTFTPLLSSPPLRQAPMLEFAVEPVKSRGFKLDRVAEPFVVPTRTDAAAPAAVPHTDSVTGSSTSALPLADDDPTVVFLGTSAAVPSKYRNGAWYPLFVPPALHQVLRQCRCAESCLCVHA